LASNPAINTNARLEALRVSLFGILPAGKLPRYGAGETPLACALQIPQRSRIDAN
jgi:hypothetical protein